MSRSKEQEAADRDHRDARRKDYYNAENCKLLSIVVAIEENHAFSASPGLQVVDVLAAIVGEPGAEEGHRDFTRANQIDAHGETCILYNHRCKEGSRIGVLIKPGQYRQYIKVMLTEYL